ncbi:MAG: phytanoyl-CoA dioxygenase family protein [Hyphomicrobiaceae bacterium]
MAGTLTGEQVAGYRRDGFVLPIDVLSGDEAAAWRGEVETAEATHRDGALPHPLNQYFRVNAQVVLPFIARFALDTRILDAVESLLGPDLLIWSAELFIKEPGTPKVVSWHQDLTYWGMGETDEQVTAWLALSPATAQSGCMRFVAGSHNNRIVAHRDTFHADNLLSRGQEIAVEVDERDAVLAELQPGQMSLHHGRMFHASGPNLSDDRRIGLAIRYVTPGVRQIVAARDYAMLARGIDRERNWIHVLPPRAPFAPEALALYEEIMRDQSGALAQGASQSVGLYGGATGTAKA